MKPLLFLNVKLSLFQGLLILSLLILPDNQTCAQDGRIDDFERTFLQNYLRASFLETAKILNDIDDELWLYKSEESVWSIAECMEHIMLAEHAVFNQLQKALEGDLNTKKSLRDRDGLVIGFAVDRGKKVKTPLPPKMVTLSREGYLAALKRSRSKIEAFINDPTLQLRSHFGASPFGEVDAYQLALIIGAHGLRHTAQMKQIIGEYFGKPVEY